MGDDHLLEIGTGWGGMALHAASRYGCRVTTTTISREQREYAEARVRAAGLEDRVTVLGADYRDLEGTFDKLVSLEMIEAVGWQYFGGYFRRCSELLEPHGLFFLQAIVVEDGAYEAEKRARSFANDLIFPGGCLPSLEVIQRHIARDTDMRTIWLDDISPSYVLTLRHWRERFVAAAAELDERGYDERFRRLWELWLALSEAGFREARIADVQLVAAKPGWAGRLVVRAGRTIVGFFPAGGRNPTTATRVQLGGKGARPPGRALGGLEQLVAEVRVGDRGERHAALVDRLALQLGDAVLGDDRRRPGGAAS